jgi:hypothetical protein
MAKRAKGFCYHTVLGRLNAASIAYGSSADIIGPKSDIYFTATSGHREFMSIRDRRRPLWNIVHYGTSPTGDGLITKVQFPYQIAPTMTSRGIAAQLLRTVEPQAVAGRR